MNDRAAKARNPRNVQYLRKTNRGAILRELVKQGKTSRNELASKLNLTKMAVSTIVADLLREELVQELGLIEYDERVDAQSIGRKPIALSVMPHKLNAIGIFIMRYEIQCIVIDIAGNIIDQGSALIPEDVDNKAFEQLLVSLIRNVLATHANLPFVGIGVASIGPLDIQGQVLLYPPNFRGIGGVKIGELLRQVFHMPVYMDNDMNASALAEQFYGLGRNVRNMIYIGFGSGVGAGVIVNGSMLHGGSGFAGELGHVSTDLNGPLCSCGQRGCLEIYTGTGALLEAAGVRSIEEFRQRMEESPPSPAVSRCWAQYIRAISAALVTVANLFDPDIAVIGDQNGLLTDEHMARFEYQLNSLMFQHGFRTIRVASSSFGPLNPLIGGAALVFQEIFRGKLAV